MFIVLGSPTKFVEQTIILNIISFNVQCIQGYGEGHVSMQSPQMRVPALFQIFTKCGVLKHINSGDIVMADCGLAQLKIPTFLKGRANLSAVEEIEIRKIATKARIHVERFNERPKEFRLIGRKISLSLAPRW